MDPAYYRRQAEAERRRLEGHQGEIASADEAVAKAEATFPGLCKVATIEKIEVQGWSLNPGRYVGTEVEEFEDEEFGEQLAAAPRRAAVAGRRQGSRARGRGGRSPHQAVVELNERP